MARRDIKDLTEKEKESLQTWVHECLNEQASHRQKMIEEIKQRIEEHQQDLRDAEVDLRALEDAEKSYWAVAFKQWDDEILKEAKKQRPTRKRPRPRSARMDDVVRYAFPSP